MPGRKKCLNYEKIGPKRLWDDLAALKRLYDLSTRSVNDRNQTEILEEILSTAIVLSKADKGIIQLFDDRSGALKIIAQRGFQQPFLDFFANVYPEIGGHGASCACASAYARRQVIVVEDVTQSPIFFGTPALDIMLAAEARACQSIPLISRDGQLVGMLNTYNPRPIRAKRLSLQFVELLAGQAADIIIHIKTQNELRKNEAELLRLDRLNLVGEMAAALGHEIRNPLTTVRGYLQMLQRKPECVTYYDQFNIMIEELDRSTKIISDFLSLAKNKAVERKNYNLNNIISSLIPLLQAEALRVGQELKIDMTDVPDFNMDEKEIRQLLLNLSHNAFDAMDSGGKLTIGTSVKDGNVVLTVKDTGTGIPQKLIDKLGTPFLSTKENGTGLGLPVCYRISERHGAKIDVKTSPEGTIFNVYFNIAPRTEHLISS